MKCIDFRYGLFVWICVFIAAAIPMIRYMGFRCPRCRRSFSVRYFAGFRVPKWSVDTCAHCGLRALGQHDLLRFWESKRMEAENAVEPTD